MTETNEDWMLDAAKEISDECGGAYETLGVHEIKALISKHLHMGNTDLVKAEAALIEARLAVNDWHNCSTPDELLQWRIAQEHLIICAKDVARVEIRKASTSTGRDDRGV